MPNENSKHCVLLRKMPPPPEGEWGGMERLMLDWLERVNYAHCRITIAVTPGWKLRFEKELALKALPVAVIEIPFSFSFKSFRRFQNMLRFLDEIKADIVVFYQGWFHEFILPEVIAGFLATGNHAFMHENLGPAGPPPKTSRRFLGFIPGLGIWWFIARSFVTARAYFSRKILVVSNEIKDMVVTSWAYPPNKVRVCYHGVDVMTYSPSEAVRIRMRKLLNIPPEETVIIITARLTDQKRVDRAIEAMDVVSHEFPGLKLLIAGSGPNEGDLKALAKSKPCSQKIVFLGHVTNVEDYLKMSDINVLPSDNEGFGIALVEALAVGLVCIATPCPGPNEIITDGVNGFLVDKSTDGVVEGLRKALRLSPKDRQKMVEGAIVHARTNFEIDHNIADVLGVVGIPVAQKTLSLLRK